MPREIIWVIRGKEIDIGAIEPNQRKLAALEAALSVVHDYLPELVVARSQLPFGEMAYANEPSATTGSTVLKFPCGHEYNFGDKNAFVRPMCKDCDAELARRVRESSHIWFSKNVTKPVAALDKLKGAISTIKPEDKKI